MEDIKTNLKELTSGEYVRTNRGTFDRYITKHKDSSNNYSWYTFENRGNITNPENYILKHSENILDLIEVGDIVHTRDVLNEDYYWMFDEEMVQATKETILEGIELVDILTRELYQQNCFKVEE